MTCCQSKTPRLDTTTGTLDCVSCGATLKRPRGRPPVGDKRTRRVGMSDAEWRRAQELARAAGYTSTSRWVRKMLGV